MTFKEFFEQEDFVQFITETFEGQSAAQKPWSAKKSEILGMWHRLKPNMPILMTPMSSGSEGKTRAYGEDGIRISGSWQFIAAVIGRLKEILYYENPKSKLRLIFKGVDSAKNVRPDRQSFVFYVNMQDRGKKKGI